MPKLAGFNRKRIGHRNYVALFESRPATVDEYGHIAYTTGAWTTVIQEWSCELVDAEGGEEVDGFMTKATTEKIAIGEALPLKSVPITTRHRCTIDGQVYGITAVRDVSGDGFTYRVELKATK